VLPLFIEKNIFAGFSRRFRLFVQTVATVAVP
jgi:hypothetical protein